MNEKEVIKMHTIDSLLHSAIEAKGDLSEHLQTLEKYAKRCETITELGVRWVCSTWAFISARPRKVTSFDVIHYVYHGVPANLIHDIASQNQVEFQFHEDNVLSTDKIEQTDLLFIDTLHSYKQLKLELALHAKKVNKYIIVTNVVTYGAQNEGPVPIEKLPTNVVNMYHRLENKTGLMPAITEFLSENPNWRVCEFFQNNNGLCVLERIPVASVSGLPVTSTVDSTTFTGTSSNQTELDAPVALEESVAPPTPLSSPAPAYLNEKPKKGLWVALGVLAGLAILGLAGTVAYLLLKK
jgi:hypothetical protein